MTANHYKGAHGALIIFDLCDSYSFSSVQLWLNELNKHTSPTCVVAVIGNKADLTKERTVSKAEINNLKLYH